MASEGGGGSGGGDDALKVCKITIKKAKKILHLQQSNFKRHKII